MSFYCNGFMKVNKYNACKVNINGVVYDSMKEYERYMELSILQKSGMISGLRRQVKFVLIPAKYEETEDVFIRGKHQGEKKRGKLIESECAYYADSVYYDNNEEQVVEDVKGYKKGQAYNLFVIKRKLMLQVYGIRIKEV
jgi:hypothetical protein